MINAGKWTNWFTFARLPNEEIPEVKIIIIDLSKGVSFWEKIINNLKH
jgi:hypothetical protein